MRMLLSLTVALSITALACASTYVWVDTKRPPVAIKQAISKAEAELGEERNRYYCTSATIAGAKNDDDAAWRLRFCAEDGSSKYIQVKMTGDVTVQHGNHPIRDVKHDHAPSNLEEARSRIAAILDSSKFPIETTDRQTKSIKISRATRKFQIHTGGEHGTYAKNATEFVGPTEQGYWIRLTVHDELPPSTRQYAPQYWFGYTWRYPLANKKVLVYECRYGWQFPNRLRNEIADVLGEPIVDPW